MPACSYYCCIFAEIMSKGRILALDYGSKRTGIAVTDELQLIASGLKTVATIDLMKTLEAYLENEKVDTLVVGEPKQMDASPSEIQQEIDKFLQKLNKRFPKLKVARQDERFTSKLAARSLVEAGVKKSKRQDKALVDEVSATLILQAYLDRIQN